MHPEPLMGCAASSGGAVGEPTKGGGATPAKPAVSFAETPDQPPPVRLRLDTGDDFFAAGLAPEDDDPDEVVQRYQGRPHATSLLLKPFRVDVSQSTIAANDPSEDRLDVRDTGDTAGQTLVGIFDGHGGSSAAQFCVERTLDLFLAAREEGLDVTEALSACVSRSEEGYLKQCRERHAKRDSCGVLAGTCALIVHVDKLARAISVANVGDSRAVLAERDSFGILSASPLSFDHSAQSDYERHRLASTFGNPAKPIVHEDYDEYACDYNRTVHGLTMFTRSIGDFELKKEFAAEFFNGLVPEAKELPMVDEANPWIIHEPHVMFRQLHHQHEFVIAACDGLWDEMSSDTAVYLVGHFFKKNPKASEDEAAEFLLAQALNLVVKRLEREEPEMGVDTVEKLKSLPPGKEGRRALHDDITIAVIRLKYHEEGATPVNTPLGRTDSEVRQGPNRLRKTSSREQDSHIGEMIGARLADLEQFDDFSSTDMAGISAEDFETPKGRLSTGGSGADATAVPGSAIASALRTAPASAARTRRGSADAELAAMAEGEDSHDFTIDSDGEVEGGTDLFDDEETPVPRVRKRSSNVERESFSELPGLPEELTLEIDLGDSGDLLGSPSADMDGSSMVQAKEPPPSPATVAP